MSANFDSKVALVSEIKEKIQKSKSMVFINYRGITVADDTELRKKFRASNVEYRVYKNRLMAKALNELNITGCDDMLQDTTAVAFAYEDETANARIAKEYVDKVKTMELKFGIMDGKILDQNMVKTLATLPSKPALVGQLLSVLNGPIRGVCVALKAISEKE